MVMNLSKEPWKEVIIDGEWICKRNMKIGMWNVQSLFWSGALKLLHNDFGMEEAPENGKESSHSAHASGMNEWMYATL